MRKASRLFLLVLMCGGAGCRQAGLRGDRVGAPPAPAADRFEEIGERKLSAVVSPESYILARCGYLVNGGSQYLELEEPIAEAPEAARAELARIIARVEESMRERAEESLAAGDGMGLEPAGPAPERTYELSVRAGWIADLVLGDQGNSGAEVSVLARVNGRAGRVRVPAPRLLRDLRQLSLRSLRHSMTRPRRALDWQYLAEAGFLDSGLLAPPPDRSQESLSTVGAELLRRLAESPDPRPLAQALFKHVHRLDPERLTAFLHHEHIALRLLALVGAASSGSRPALNEILTLSLEYPFEVRLFHRALRALLPDSSNPALYRKYPASGDNAAALAFLREIHTRLPEAQYREGQGWALPSRES